MDTLGLALGGSSPPPLATTVFSVQVFSKTLLCLLRGEGLLILTKHPRNPPMEEETLPKKLNSPFSRAISSPGGQAPSEKGPPNTTSVTNYNKRKTKTFDHASPTVPGKMTNLGLHLGADEVQEMPVEGKGDLGGIDGVPSLGTHGARLWAHVPTGTHLGKAPCRCPPRPLETLSGP